VERTLPEAQRMFFDPAGCHEIVKNNAEAGVTWLHSYLASDRRKTFSLRGTGP